MKQPLESLLVQAADAELLRNSSSGGAFTLLAERVLASGGAVVGAAFDADGVVRHRLVESAAGLSAMRKSKYVRSDVKPGIKALDEMLPSGRLVLFSGTPCQVAAVRRRFPAERFANLIAVDVLCHGTPAPQVFGAYLAEREKREGCVVSRYDWRDKTDGWTPLKTRVTFANGRTYLERLNAYYYAFQKRVSLEDACGRCPWMRPERVGDITLGDGWGLMRHWPWPDLNRGLSLVLVNTELGRKWWWSTAADLYRFRRVPFSAAMRKQRVLTSPPPLPAAQSAFRTEFMETGSFATALRKALDAIAAADAGDAAWAARQLERLERHWWLRLFCKKERKRLRAQIVAHDDIRRVREELDAIS